MGTAVEMCSGPFGSGAPAGFLRALGWPPNQSLTLSAVCKVSSGKPFCRANHSAPSPTSSTCGVLSITSRATAATRRMCSRPATPPHDSVLPSITQASRLMAHTLLPTAPTPTDRTVGSSSTASAPASTASRAGLPAANCGRAMSTAVRPNGQVATTTGSAMGHTFLASGRCKPSVPATD